MKRSCFYIFFLFIMLCAQNVWAQDVSVRTYKDVPYIEGTTNKQQMLDLYVPRALSDKGMARNILRAMMREGLPVLVYIHGGAWTGGDKAQGAEIGQFYAERGAMVVNVNFRLAPDAPYPVFCEDIAAALRWVVDNVHGYGGNPKHIVLAGFSSGAHLVALEGTHPEFLLNKGLQLNMFKAIVAVEPAALDLTAEATGANAEVQRKLINKVFDWSQESLLDASPLAQVLNLGNSYAGGLSYFDIFVSSKRGSAVEQAQQMSTALIDSGNYGNVTVLDDIAHKEMNAEIYNPSSPVFLALSRHLGL